LISNDKVIEAHGGKIIFDGISYYKRLFQLFSDAELQLGLPAPANATNISAPDSNPNRKSRSFGFGFAMWPAGAHQRRTIFPLRI
jgi:hypothetical protein